MRTAEFRAEVIAWSINSTLWVFMSLAMVELVYGQVNNIAGWTRDEALILSVTASMFNSVLWWFIYPSILRLVESVRTGYFDFYLLKPVNPRFFSSITRFEFDNYLRVGVSIPVLAIIIIREHLQISPTGLFGYGILFVLGLFIFYCLFFILATLSFWLVQMQELENLLDTIVSSGRYPADIFKGVWRLLAFYIIPVAFVATFPARMLLKGGGVELIIQAITIAGIFWLVSEMVWNRGMKEYSSASS